MHKVIVLSQLSYRELSFAIWNRQLDEITILMRKRVLAILQRVLFILGVGLDPARIAEIDSDAVHAVKSGDIDRFGELVERYQVRIVGLIGRQVGDRVLAEDLTQDVFVRAYRGLKSFKGDSQFSTWLTRIALNVVKSYFVSKRHKHQKHTESFDPIHHDRATSGEVEDEVTEEMKAALRAALQELESPFQEVAILCGLEGRPYEEAASLLGIPVGTVRSRLNRARVRLKNAIGCVGKEAKSGRS